MRFSASILLAAAAALATLTAAAAQEAPPAEQPAEAAKAEPAKAEPGLSDLSATVETLQDTPPPAETPAETPPDQPEPLRGVRIERPAVSAVVPVGPDGQPLPPPEETAPEAAPEQAQPEQPATPPAETPAPPAVPPGERFVEPLTRAQLDQLAATAARGRLLGVIAATGQIATRDMLSRVADPDAAGIAGWIAEPEGNGVTVTFYAAPQGEAPPGIVFRANILGGRVVSRDVFLAPEGRPQMSRLQARMAAARTVAAAQAHRPCGADQFNYFVVPPASAAAPVEVYQFSPQTARGRYPVGGHFRTTVAADGTIAETRGFTNACLDVAVPEVPAGTRPPPLAVTHLMDPLPAEIHVFLSIWTQRPLVVVAGDPQRLFQVTGEGIAEVPRDAAR